MAKIIGNPSALQKLAHVDPRAVKQQGTTREVYHYMEWNATLKQYEFFVDLNNTKQLFKNIDNNRLTEGEALVVKRIGLRVIQVNPVDDEMIIGNRYPSAYSGTQNILTGKLDLIVGNQTVIKDLSLIKAKAFTRARSVDEGDFIDLESEIVIPKDIEFKAIIKQLGNGKPLGTEIEPRYFLGIHLEGYGKLLNINRSI